MMEMMAMAGPTGEGSFAGVPGQQEMGRMMYFRGYSALDNLLEVKIEQRMKWGQALSEVIGVEIAEANKYRVLDPAGKQIQFMAETTDFCTRNMKRGCCTDCAGYSAEILDTPAAGYEAPFLKMERATSCTCCCFNRPKLDIFEKQTGQQIGGIIDPFACCNTTFTIMDSTDNDVLAVNGGCCQWGMFCSLPCGPCAEINFDILDKGSGAKVGHLRRKVPGCFSFCVDPDVSNYYLEFGEVQNTQWKALLIALVAFVDYRYFSELQDPEDIGDDGIIGMVNNS